MGKIFSSYTKSIIILNVLFFFLAITLGFNSFLCSENLCSNIALQPSSILQGKGIWTFLTSMFMHANFTHLFVNMISLMFIGGFVEKLIGKKRFVKLYFASGIFAGILFILLAGLFGHSEVGSGLFGSPTTYAVGASGAIFGLGGLLAILTPNLPVLVFFILPLPMWAAMTFLIVVIWALSFGIGIPIGNSAHLGGLIVGLIYGLIIKKKFPHRAKMIRRYFSK
jgi:membrane associated rhomboid family serine protease